MADEPDLLNALAAAPADDLLRQVYADWLDENPAPGRAEKAEYLRLEAETATAAPERTTAIELRLVELSGEVPHEWAATASKRPLENCARVSFKYQCPLRWEALTPTRQPTVRHCSRCRQQVYYCRNISEANAYARRGRCVAVDVGQPRRAGDLETTISMGLPRVVNSPSDPVTVDVTEEMILDYVGHPPADDRREPLFTRLRRRLGL